MFIQQSDNRSVSMGPICSLSNYLLIVEKSFPSPNSNNIFNIFLLLQASIIHLMMEGLPQDSTSLQNAAILDYSHSKTWPLILDSLGMAEEWLKNRKEGEILTVKYQVCSYFFLHR